MALTSATLEKDNLFVITRGPCIRTESTLLGGETPVFDRSYDGYVYKVIDREGDLIVAEVVYTPRPGYMHAEFLGARKLLNLKHVTITSLPQRMLDALCAATQPEPMPISDSWEPSVMTAIKYGTVEEFDRMARKARRDEELRRGQSREEFNHAVKKAALEAELHQQQIAQGLEKDPNAIPPTNEKSE